MTAFHLKSELQLLSDQMDWTVERYHQMIAAGILTEDDKVELLAGKIVHMSPVGWQHAACISELQDYFLPLRNQGYRLRSENPVTLPNQSEPEPDFAIVKDKANKYSDGHPTPDDIFLLIEVSDLTLKKDMEAKYIIYSEAGIKEYWVVNLPERKLLQFVNPDAEKGMYSTSNEYGATDIFEHTIFGTIEVANILPEIN